MKRKKKNPFNVPDIASSLNHSSKTSRTIEAIFIIFICLSFIAFGIYQLSTGMIRVGINSRGGTAINYGGASIAFGLFISWLFFMEYKKGKKKKSSPPKN